MNKICTTIEQSKKLIELGIDADTADMYYAPDANIFVAAPYITTTEDETLIPAYKGAIPTWSLSALLELMPFQIIENNKRYGFCSWKGYNSQGETYCFEYNTNIGPCLTETYYWNDPIDSALEMVCWLLENKKI